MQLCATQKRKMSSARSSSAKCASCPSSLSSTCENHPRQQQHEHRMNKIDEPKKKPGMTESASDNDFEEIHASDQPQTWPSIWLGPDITAIRQGCHLIISLCCRRASW